MVVNIREAAFAMGVRPDIQPSNAAPAAFARIAQANQSASDSIGAAVTSVTKDIGANITAHNSGNKTIRNAQLAAGYSTLELNLNQQLDDFTKTVDPNDPDALSKFWATVNPQIDAYSSTAKTPEEQAIVADHVAQLRLGVGNKAASDFSNLAAVGITQNINNYASSQVAIVQQNPDQLDAKLADSRRVLPTLIPETASALVRAKAMAEGQQQVDGALITAAVNGKISSIVHMTKADGTPDLEGAAAAAKQLADDFASGKMDKYASALTINGDRSQFEQLKTAAMNVPGLVDKMKGAKDTADIKAGTDELDGSEAQILYGLMDPKTGQPTATADSYKAVLAMAQKFANGNYPPEVKAAAIAKATALTKTIDGINSGVKVDPKVSQATASGFMTNINKGKPPTQGEISQAVIDHKISVEDAVQVEKARTASSDAKAANPQQEAALTGMRTEGLDKFGHIGSNGELYGPDGQPAADIPDAGGGGFFGIGGSPVQKGFTLAQQTQAIQDYQAWFNRTLTAKLGIDANPARWLDPNSPDYIVKGFDWNGELAKVRSGTPLSPFTPGAGTGAVPATGAPPAAVPKPALNPDGTIPGGLNGLVKPTSGSGNALFPAPSVTKASYNPNEPSTIDHRVPSPPTAPPSPPPPFTASNPQQFWGAVKDISGSATYARKGEQLTEVKGLIFHHTGGHGDAQGVVSVLNERGLGVQYVIDRSGQIYQTLPTGARGAQILPAENGSGLSNSNSLGVEVIAADDKSVLPVQVEAAKQLAAALEAKYHFTDNMIFGHGEVNPSHKEADEGRTIVSAIRSSHRSA